MTVETTLLILKLLSIVKLTRSELEGFIVGGELSEIERFPHSAFISVICHGRTFSCGASVLNNALLITAAHCVYICNDTSDFTIRAFTGSKIKFEGLVSNIISFKMHEGYDNDKKGKDIALLKLEKELVFGATVKKVMLVKKLPKSKNAIVAGWGRIDTNGTKGNLLKYTNQQIISEEECYWRLGTVPKGTFCGRDTAGYPDRGDSGSALVVRDSIMIGIVSFKKILQANSTGATTVYTNVPYYYNWIVKNSRKMYCAGKDN